jgi:hypothetical protein
MHNMSRLSLFILFLFIPSGIFAQNDLMDLFSDSTARVINYTTATFKSTRIMNGHSVQKMPPGQLDFRISHRFGPVNGGAYEFFGLDQANTHFSLETGITNWLMIGVGRGTYEKTFDGFAKFSILRQSTGAKEMPVSLSIFTSAAIESQKWSDPERNNFFSSRVSYVAQVLVARKFSSSFSFQLTPSYVHRNLVPTELDPNDLYALGAGGRMKLSKRVSVNAEYYWVINSNPSSSPKTYDPLSIGVDIETGGHVFQLLLTNSVQMIEKGFIGETTGSWLDGGIRLGFNISRVFNLKKH